jgi:hypothetical protein
VNPISVFESYFRLVTELGSKLYVSIDQVKIAPNRHACTECRQVVPWNTPRFRCLVRFIYLFIYIYVLKINVNFRNAPAMIYAKIVK